MSDITIKTPVSNPFYILLGLLWDFIEILIPLRCFTYLSPLSLCPFFLTCLRNLDGHGLGSFIVPLVLYRVFLKNLVAFSTLSLS